MGSSYHPIVKIKSPPLPSLLFRVRWTMSERVHGRAIITKPLDKVCVYSQYVASLIFIQTQTLCKPKNIIYIPYIAHGRAAVPPRHRATWSLTFCTITDVFRFSSRIFHLMTSKMNHDDRNGHFACNFFHCEAMISSFAKVTGPQSRLILEKTEDQKCLDSKNVVLGIENVINMTAVVILVILLIILNIGCL